MNPKSVTLTLAALAMTASVAGCAAHRDASTTNVAPHNHMRDAKGMWVGADKAGDAARAGAAAPAGAQGASGLGAAKAGAHSMKDMKAMCDMHKQMMSTADAGERAAMMDKRMKGMSDHEKKEHMRMMDQHCQ